MATVPMSFANNFWGKDDAGVDPLLARMHNAKQTCDELKSFYNARAAVEEEYSRKLLALARKPLGSQEAGSLRTALDTVRGEVEAMGKCHQNTAAQMRSELEEPLAAFAGAMKERRKIVQSGIEKVLKVKVQQTQSVNKTRDRYEQECLKIKGYLAQGHMVMGQEERKNKAKLEKTQINLATSNAEYETAVKILEETTGRWNRDWKAAADKFQELEEERLDFTKSSLWSFANIASTVCVSDDASCEKVRLSLETCEVEKDIVAFIKDHGTGQEIPNPPRYINFCRGDVGDNQSIASNDDDSYSVAQFQRTINPSFRSSSPQPSMLESHHDPNSTLAREFKFGNSDPSSNRASMAPPQQNASDRGLRNIQQEAARMQYGQQKQGPAVTVPHDPFPLDGMTMLCRPNGASSDISSADSGLRRASRDSQSDYSNPTSFSSRDPNSGASSPLKEDMVMSPISEKSNTLGKKKSLVFNSPFRRKKSIHEQEVRTITPSSRNTWGASPRNTPQTERPAVRNIWGQNSISHTNVLSPARSVSPEPVDPRASFQLNVGNNVFDVATPDRRGKPKQISQAHPEGNLDPIAQALAELKGVTKQSSIRMTADRYAGISPSPAPNSSRQANPPLSLGNGALIAGLRGTPPPSYDQPVSRLGAPPAAHTSKAMQQSTQKYVSQTRDVFSSPVQQRPGSSQTNGGWGARSQSRPRTAQQVNEVPRAISPLPDRSVSPRPSIQGDRGYRTASPNPMQNSPHQARAQQPQYSTPPRAMDLYTRHASASPAPIARTASPNPYHEQTQELSMSMQLASPADDGYGSQRSRNGHGRSMTGGNAQRPTSSYGANNQVAPRQRSKSVADGRQFTREGRPILHFARAMYVYKAAIPEELSFAKGDLLAILRLQDDGWWEAEVAGRGERSGLVPSNYLVKC